MTRTRLFASRRAVLSMLAGALLAGGSAAATETELYKWTDAGGVVHYSDVPPPQGAEAAKRVRLNGTESPTPPEQKPEEAKADAMNKPQQPAPEPLPDTPEGRKRLCEQAQTQVDLLQSKFQVGDANGKPLDDKARADRTAQAKHAVTRFCQNPG